MQEMDHWVPDSLPSFTKKLHILVVDHETLSLKHLSSLLRQQSYNVTTTGLGCIALSMIQEKGDQFDLVMANVSMPDMDSFSFLHVLLKMNIAVIFMSSTMNLKVATKALAEGACYFLQKPVSKDDLKYVWQHVYRSNINIAKLTHKANCVDKAKSGQEFVGFQNDNPVVLSRSTDTASYNNNYSINYQLMSHNEKVQNMPTNSHDTLVASYFEGERSADDIEGTNKEGVTYYSKPTNFEHTKADEDNGRGKEYYISRNTRSRIVWNLERRRKFSDALNKLGRPKLILKLMNEPCLTLRQVANHLQKYKAQVESIKKGRKNKLAPRMEASKFDCSVMTQLPPLVQRQQNHEANKFIQQNHEANKSTQQNHETNKSTQQNHEANKTTQGGSTSLSGGKRFRLIAPKPALNPRLLVSANFVNHGLIMFDHNFQHVASNYNSVPYSINKTTPEVTSYRAFDEIQFPDIHQVDVAQQLEAMEFCGTSEGIQLMSKNIALPDSTNLDNIAANFGNEGSQQQFAECDYILNVLEDNPYDLRNDFSLSDVDKYSEWLRNTVLEDESGLDKFINDDAEIFPVEINQ
ncbi:two-component response regulator ORR26-like isoform X2 [Cucurbita pepo subsp. pepo]|uniref:two-component response regulator ORR26-like isoform X2 n=1 Tax=Cucurbita pepo subsp. pepo TaxID=3664 RepID=UPI000C9D882A|nr:two-component response regulator ORR26-like isoform X2 [Cucurbita pepo subsp. pepo]